MAEVRLVAETAFEADLRQAQVRVLDQLLGPGDALLANPFLWRTAGAALERAGEMTARQRTSLGQFGHLQGFAEAIEDQLFHQLFALRTEAAGAFFLGLRDCRASGALLELSHGECPNG
ncbi:hypothetical protein D3C73_1410700 [compost metagenome]